VAALSERYAKYHQSLVSCHWGFRKSLKKRGAYCETDAMNTRRVGRKALPPTSVSDPSSASLVSLRAAMSILYLCSSAAISAVRRAGLWKESESISVRTFQVAKW